MRTLVSVMTFVAAALGGALLAADESSPPKRARPPKWSTDVRDTFFADAREKLVGARPDYGQVHKESQNSDHDAMPPPTDTVSSSEVWSGLIDADAIETEVKRLAQAVASDVTTPSAFKGGGYKACRSSFSVLAVLFAVAGEYDHQVRWQDVAAGLREQFARAGHNCKVGTDQTYQEANLRKQELVDLVAGSRPQVPMAEPTVTDWSEVADRPPLMQRLNLAHQDRLTKWLANEREFAAHRVDIRHEAQIVALLASVVSREGFDYWDDETFAGFATELQQSASEIAAAAERGNFQQAQQAVSRATKACADCHDGYRG